MGSTSNSFRTRAALFEGVVEAMVADELPAVEPAVLPHTPEALIDALVDLFEFLIGPQQVVTAARLALYVEAGHDETLRAALARGRAAMEQRIRPAFADLGAPDPDLAVQLLATTFEGMFLHVTAQHAQIDPRALVELVVRAVLTDPQAGRTSRRGGRRRD